MIVRGLRGAITAEQNTPEEIWSSTQTLLRSLLDANPTLRKADIASVIFTVTQDLQAAYPAKAARLLGWDQVPLLCALELDVPESLPRCIRVLIHWNTSLPQSEIQPVYLREAERLRPDLFSPHSGSPDSDKF